MSALDRNRCPFSSESAGQHTHTRIAVFLTDFSGNRSKLSQVRVMLAGDSLKDGVVAVVIAAYKNKGYAR